MKHILQGLETLDKKTEQRKLLWKRLSKLETQKLFQVGVDDRKKSPQVWEIKYFFFWDFLLSFCRPNVKTISALWPNCLKKSCSYAELTPTSPNVAITHSRWVRVEVERGACRCHASSRSFPTADFYILQSWQKLKLLGLEMVAAVKFSKKKGVSPSTSLVMLNNLVKKVHWSLFSPQYSWVWLELENSLVYFKISPYLPNRSMAGITLFAWTSVVVRVKLNEISSQTHHWILITSFGQALHPWD